MRLLSESGRTVRTKRCATCGLPIVRGAPALHLNGMDFHIGCTNYREGGRLTG
jgi:hypothetical protein